MRIEQSVVGLILLVSLGCGQPTEQQCSEACTNVASVYASRVEGDVLTAELKEGDGLAACVRTCLSEERAYVACLRAASSPKALHECVGVSD